MLYSESGVGVASHHHPLVALPHRLHLDRGQPHHHQLYHFYSTVSSSIQPSCPSSFRRILHLLQVILMLLLAVRLRCIIWDLSRSFLLRLAITIFSIILIYTMAQVNVVSRNL